MFYCNQYNALCDYLYEKKHPKYQHFEMLADSEKFDVVMSSIFVKHTANNEMSPHINNEMSPHVNNEMSPHVNNEMSPHANNEMSPHANNEMSPC